MLIAVQFGLQALWFFALCNAIYYHAIVISMPARFRRGDAHISVLAIANPAPEALKRKRKNTVYAIVTPTLLNLSVLIKSTWKQSTGVR